MRSRLQAVVWGGECGEIGEGYMPSSSLTRAPEYSAHVEDLESKGRKAWRRSVRER